MNKVLEAFERIKKGVDDNSWDGNEYDDLDIIENELIRLDIIDKNPYEAAHCLAYDTYEDYILWYKNWGKVNPPLTKEEFRRLKEKDKYVCK